MEGSSEGNDVGALDGVALGALLCTDVGGVEGTTDGPVLGWIDGVSEDTFDGVLLGIPLGIATGDLLTVGRKEGSLLCTAVGAIDELGAALGLRTV